MGGTPAQRIPNRWFLSKVESKRLSGNRPCFVGDLFGHWRPPEGLLSYVSSVIRSVNADIPRRITESGQLYVAVDEQSIVDYLRTGCWPSPISMAWWVSEDVWQSLLDQLTLSSVAREMRAAIADVDQIQTRMQLLVELCRNYRQARGEEWPPAMALIRTRPLTPRAIHAWFPPTPDLGDEIKQKKQRVHAFAWLERLRNHLFISVLDPISQSRTDAVERTVLLKSTAFVLDAEAKKLFVEHADEHGRFEASKVSFPVLRPLEGTKWIDAFVRTHLAHDAGLAGHWQQWLVECLRREIKQIDLASVLEQSIRDAMSLDVNVTQACMRTLRAKRRHALWSSDYSTSWQWLSLDSRLRKDAPRLAHLFIMALREKLVSSKSDLHELKAKLMDMGLTESGWRLLCRKGSRAYLSLLQRYSNVKVAWIIAHVRLLQGLNRKELPPADLLDSLYLVTVNNFERDVARMPPQLLRHAWDQLDITITPGDRQHFLEVEFPSVLRWWRHVQPAVDANQARSGWLFWAKRCIEWEREQRVRARNVQWPSALQRQRIGAIDVIPLQTEWDLLEEGFALRHCIATYAPRCMSGEARCFSLRHAVSGRRRATMSLLRVESAGEWIWIVEQVRGFANRAAEPIEERTANEILIRFTSDHRV